MKLRLSLVIAMFALALSAVVAIASPSATAARSTNGAPIPNLTATYNGNTYAGTFNVTSFKKVGGAIRAYGTFTGTNTNNPADTVTSNGYANVVTGGTTNAAAAAASGSCQILDLTLGPINLDLLGLVVTTNPIHLNITAQQGPGNLLGNLLCAVTGLLDNTGTTGGGGLNGLLNAITNLLNQILGQL